MEFVVRPRKKEISGGVWELMRRGISKRVGKTRDQLEFTIKVRAIFDGFDLDGTGVLTSQELRKALKTLGVNVSNKEMMDLMDRFDSNQDNVIDYGEFEDMIKDLIPPPEFDVGGIFLEQKLKSMFAKMDQNGDKVLDKDEIREALVQLGMPMTDAHLERVVRAADTNQDGVVDFNEFCQAYSKHPMMADYTPEELEAIASKWEVDDKIVKDGDPECRPGAKVMVRKHLQHLRGYRKFCGVGYLTRPVAETPGRWYAKFAATDEVFLSTGRHGIHELTYVPEDPRRTDAHRKGSVTDALFSPPIRAAQERDGESFQRSLDHAMHNFRLKLILARLNPHVKMR